MNAAQVEFSTYCVGVVAEALNMNQATVYDKFRTSGILTNYIAKCYDVLHTFGRLYLVEDLIDMMKRKGVL